MNVISPGSPVIHARRVAVQYWISSPGYIGAPVRASLPLNFAFMVLIMAAPYQTKWTYRTACNMRDIGRTLARARSLHGRRSMYARRSMARYSWNKAPAGQPGLWEMIDS